LPATGKPWRFQIAGKISRIELASRLEKATGVKSKNHPGGPSIAKTSASWTGGAGAEMKQAAAEGVDTYHYRRRAAWTFALAEDWLERFFTAAIMRRKPSA